MIRPLSWWLSELDAGTRIEATPAALLGTDVLGIAFLGNEKYL
jgi:hypothetical protein